MLTRKRAAAARERTRKDREQAIADGLDELDQCLAHRIDVGLAGFATTAGKSCRVISQRLVDAKAPGVAARVENLPARLFALPDPSGRASQSKNWGNCTFDRGL